MTTSGGQSNQTPTLLQQWRLRAEQRPWIAAGLLVFGIVVAVASAWYTITGERIADDVVAAWRWLDSRFHDPLATCLDKAGQNFVETNKCHEKFPP
jgi:hypothetical protein